MLDEKNESYDRERPSWKGKSVRNQFRCATWMFHAKFKTRSCNQSAVFVAAGFIAAVLIACVILFVAAAVMDLSRHGVCK